MYVILIQEDDDFRPTTAMDFLSLWMNYGYTNVQSFLMLLFLADCIIFLHVETS